MKLRDALAGVGAFEARGDDGVEISTVVHDSRAVQPGSLYCCVPGATADGHDFAAPAVEAGAAALLVERWLPAPGAEVPQVRVPRVRDVMGRIAAEVHGRPSDAVAVLGVTGTNGKTTTTYLLESIGRAAGIVPGVIGTIETRIDGARLDVPLTTPEGPELQALLARMRDQGVGLVAMEVSSHALDLGRVEGTHFAAAAFLNLSHDHLDFHGTMDAYFEAKARLFEAGRVSAAAVNVADPYGEALASRCEAAALPTLTYSIAPDRGPADLTARQVHLAAEGTSFVLDAPRFGPPTDVSTALLGSFNVANVLAAITTALAAGIELEAAVAGVRYPVRVPGRFERVDRGQAFTVIVDYAHTPDAITHALGAAREIAEGGRVLVVFGCGGDRDRAKRPLMGAAAAAGADRLYVTSDNPRSESPESIIVEVLSGVPAGVTPVVEADRATAIAAAVGDARAGDVVVVAGKGHETGQVIGETVIPFDDVQVAADALEQLGCD